jgi:hypothetical protein
MSDGGQVLKFVVGSRQVGELCISVDDLGVYLDGAFRAFVHSDFFSL